MNQIERFDHTAEPALIDAFIDAIRLGFHSGEPNDDFRNWFRAGLKADQTTLLAVLDPKQRSETTLVATLASFEQPINVGGPAMLSAHLITDVTVRSTHRRQGLMRDVLLTSLNDAVERGLPVAALTSSEATIYGRFGFGVTTMAQSFEVRTDERFAFLDSTPIPGHVEIVRPEPALSEMNAVFEQVHANTIGSLGRPHHYQRILSGQYGHDTEGPNPKLRAAIYYDATDQPRGYVTYVIEPRGDQPRAVAAEQLLAADSQAHKALWQFLATIDLTGRVKADGLPVDDPLADMLTDRRCVAKAERSDHVWLRILDPIAALQGRPWHVPGSITLQITDPQGLCEGRFTIDSDGISAVVTRSKNAAELTLSADTLAMAYLGGTSIAQLAAAGRIAGAPEAIAHATRLFSLDRPPFCATYF